MGEHDGPWYVAVAPPPALRAFVERLWVHRIDGPPPPDGRRLLPDGRIHLVWIGGMGVRIAGPQTRFMRPADAPSMLAFGASFHPGTAPYLLRTPAAAMVDRHVALDAVDPRLAARLDDRLGHAGDVRGGVAAFAHELARGLRADRTFVSERALQRRFADDVGYGPKTLQRVLRFQRFMTELAAPRIGLARAALRAGYADQSHVTREAGRLAGLSPRQLRGWTH